MSEEPYEAEAVLQSLIERYPDVLAGTQPDDDVRGVNRWLLVQREMPIADEADGPGRFALDHLFLGRDAILTLVEVKRTTDTRARREVVAQMLDYAANAVATWTPETIRAALASTSGDSEARVDELLAGHESRDAFWTRVKTNLAARRIRLVFVADVIAPELRRIVEFLNEQMSEVEVLAIEVRRFRGEGGHTLVPSMVGQTEKARQAKAGAAPSHRWELNEFEARARDEAGPEVAGRLIEIARWFEKHANGIRPGSGGKYPTFTARLICGERDVELLRVFADGAIGVNFAIVAALSLRAELRRRLAEIAGFDLGAGLGQPRGDGAALVTASNWALFESTIAWIVEELARLPASSGEAVVHDRV